MLKLKGSKLLRYRVVCSVLSNRPMIVSEIRELDETPGLKDYEVCFLELIDKLTNGTHMSINSTGTSFSIRPGFIIGGTVEHECVGRSVGYFIEAILPLCLFAKEPVHLTLTGVTNDDVDICVDLLNSVTIRSVVRRFGFDEGLPQVSVVQRGLPPNGKGQVVFTCPIVRELKAVQWMDPGLVKRVRGLAYSVRVSPQFANRMATSARGIFNPLLPDVYIGTDHIKSKELMKHDSTKPGYGLSIYAETTTGCIYGSRRGATPKSRTGGDDEDEDDDEKKDDLANAKITDPEAIGEHVAFQVLEQVDQGGCVDSSHQPITFLLMCLCPEDVSKVRIGKLTPYSVQFLRMLQTIFGTIFKLKVDEETSTIVASCVGVGYKNLSRKVT